MIEVSMLAAQTTVQLAPLQPRRIAGKAVGDVSSDPAISHQPTQAFIQSHHAVIAARQDVILDRLQFTVSDSAGHW